MGELDERHPVNDTERARRFGTEFGLGAVKQVSRTRDLPKYGLGAGLLGIIDLLVGLPVAAGVAAGPYPVAAKALVAALAGGLFAVCCALVGVSVARSTPDNRLFRYSGGLVQLVRAEPEPRVARWADVREFTVFYAQTDEEPPRLSGFLVTTVSGTSVPGLRAYWHRRELRALVAESESNLTPRLVPTMTEAYESGAAVSFGRVQVSEGGITTSRGTPSDLILWSRLKSIHVTYIDDRDGHYVNEIIIGSKGRPTEEISVSGLANGIFLAPLLAHAAAQQSVTITGYRARRARLAT